MDPVTHALSGMAIRQLGFKRKAALFVLLFSAMAPDLDYITRFGGSEVLLRYHRGITHGIFAMAGFPLLMGLIFRNKGGFFYYYALSFLGYGAHLLMDLTTQYGTRILAPLDWNRYSFGLTFVLDPWITLGLLGCVVLGRKNVRRASLIAFVTVALIMAYTAGRAYMKEEARRFLKAKLDAYVYDLYPLPNDISRWWFVTKSGNKVNAGFVDLFSRRACVDERVTLIMNDPAVAESKKAAVVQDFLNFAEHPYAEVVKENGRTVVIWRELAYAFLPGERFTARVVLDKNGKVAESRFRF